VWTYDIYQSYIKPGASDAHYLAMGRAATVFGILISVAAAFVARQFNNIHGPAAAGVRLRERPAVSPRSCWACSGSGRRATARSRACSPAPSRLAGHHGLTLPVGAVVGFKGGFLGQVLHTYPSEMAQNFWTAIFAWTTCFLVTVLVSLFTEPKRDEELKGLVYALTPIPHDKNLPWHKQPGTLAVVVLTLTVLLNFIFW
jgi:SSS family solute:Na+ symporter